MAAARPTPAVRPLPGGPGLPRLAANAGLLALGLLLVLAIRWQVAARADRVLTGEARALQTLAALVEASAGELDAETPHPGLAAIAHAADGLRTLPELGDAERDFARDDAYVYALGRLPPDRGRPRHGYELRAWPLRFGITGDSEFLVTPRGELLQGNNPSGRSGLDTGFPPPFPESTDVPEKGRAWWPREFPRHR